MEKINITREEALAKLKALKKQKAITTARIAERMAREYEQKTGKKPQVIEVW